MAWSPESNYLPQAASVSRYVCLEMIQERGFSDDVKAVRVLVQAAPPQRGVRGRRVK